jgi:hypothetical protein
MRKYPTPQEVHEHNVQILKEIAKELADWNPVWVSLNTTKN